MESPSASTPSATLIPGPVDVTLVIFCLVVIAEFIIIALLVPFFPLVLGGVVVLFPLFQALTGQAIQIQRIKKIRSASPQPNPEIGNGAVA